MAPPIDPRPVITATVTSANLIHLKIKNDSPDSLFVNKLHPLNQLRWKYERRIFGPRVVFYRPGTDPSESELTLTFDTGFWDDVNWRFMAEGNTDHRDNFLQIPPGVRFEQRIRIDKPTGMVTNWFMRQKWEDGFTYKVTILPDVRLSGPPDGILATEPRPLAVDLGAGTGLWTITLTWPDMEQRKSTKRKAVHEKKERPDVVDEA